MRELPAFLKKILMTFDWVSVEDEHHIEPVVAWCDSLLLYENFPHPVWLTVLHVLDVLLLYGFPAVFDLEEFGEISYVQNGFGPYGNLDEKLETANDAKTKVFFNVVAHVHGVITGFGIKILDNLLNVLGEKETLYKWSVSI